LHALAASSRQHLQITNKVRTMSTVTLETSHGNIVIELNDEKAPETVKNF